MRCLPQYRNADLNVKSQQFDRALSIKALLSLNEEFKCLKMPSEHENSFFAGATKTHARTPTGEQK